MITAAIIFILYSFLHRTGILSAAQPFDEAVSIGAIVLIGVAASMSSCLALVGGLLLSVSAKWSESHLKASPAHKFVPLMTFNIGRLAGYFLFGGIIAIIGRSLQLSIGTTGLVTIGIAVVMIVLGISMLKILPKQYCTFPLPKAFRTRISRLSESGNPFIGFILGALTFFIPCGFTQSVQLIALGAGSFMGGGLIMLAFALGTLPALLGISFLSSFAQGRFARAFYTFSGTVVIMLGANSFYNGLILNNIDLLAYIPSTRASLLINDPAVTIDQNGQQIISMKITSQGYAPTSFTIDANKPTWIYAVSPDGASGCAAFLTVPDQNISTQIKQGENWLQLPAPPTQDFLISCSMGVYRANVRVRGS